MKKRRGVFFYILLLLAVAAVGALAYLLNPAANPETPPVRLAPLPSPSRSPGPGSGSLPDGRIIAVDTDTVQSVLSTLTRADSYSRTLTVQRFWTDGSDTTEISTWVRGDSVRITQRRAGEEDKNILLRGGTKWIWYAGYGGVWTGQAQYGDADAYQMLSPYEELLRLDPGDILEAGSLNYEGELCIYARCRAGSLGYESVFFVSIVTGLPVRMEIYDGEKLVYAMHSSPADLSTPDSVVFSVPESA